MVLKQRVSECKSKAS